MAHASSLTARLVCYRSNVHCFGPLQAWCVFASLFTIFPPDICLRSRTISGHRSSKSTLERYNAGPQYQHWLLTAHQPTCDSNSPAATPDPQWGHDGCGAQGSPWTNNHARKPRVGKRSGASLIEVTQGRGLDDPTLFTDFSLT